MDRRVFIQGLAASSAALVTVPEKASAALRPPQSPPEPLAPPRAVLPTDPASTDNLWPLLAPLAPGDLVGLGWRVVELCAVSHGGALLRLARAESEARVHLCGYAGTPRGVAHSDGIDLVLMNRAEGASPTDEDLARVLNVLALLIRSNERAGAATSESLVSHDARLAFYRAQQALL